MTPEELTEIAKRVFGGHGWKSKLAYSIGVHPATVRRWIKGQSDIDTRTAIAVRSLEKEERHGK